jgi:hypothetical protein
MDLLIFLLLEKRIAQISSNIEVLFAFDLIKTTHAEDRSDFSKRGLDVQTYGHISNKEMSEFVNLFKNDIAKYIATGEINDQEAFVIRSKKWQLSMAIIPEFIKGSYWKLIIKTVFRETDEYQLKVGPDQFILEK